MLDRLTLPSGGDAHKDALERNEHNLQRAADALEYRANSLYRRLDKHRAGTDSSGRVRGGTMVSIPPT